MFEMPKNKQYMAPNILQFFSLDVMTLQSEKRGLEDSLMS
jgi:hypothetical protein